LDAVSKVGDLIHSKDRKDTLDVMAENYRIFDLVMEHSQMHCETLLYMFQQLDTQYRCIPPKILARKNAQNGRYAILSNPIEPIDKEFITIPKCEVSNGAEFSEINFGWDNEFPEDKTAVESFQARKNLVTIGEFFAFMEHGGYENKELWLEKDWEWIKREHHTHPKHWIKKILINRMVPRNP